MSVNESSAMNNGTNNEPTTERQVYVEPKVPSAAVQQFMSKLSGNKDFGELGAIAKAMDIESISAMVIRKLETQMSTMSDQDMSKAMSLGMQIMLQFKNPNPNVGAITKDIFDVLKVLKIDVNSILFEINESMQEENQEEGSMYALMKGYMKRSREAENPVHFTFKQQFFGFINNTINEVHRHYRHQFN